MNWNQPKVFAVRHKSEAVRSASRSGGMFTAVSDWVLEKNGVLYGCVLDENYNAVHIRTENAVDRNRMRGSKYVQSKLGNTYKNVEADLQNQRIALFSGTSCQVAGLKRYLGKEYENLICIDIVCHGVPSPKVWQAYLNWQEEKSHSKVTAVDFRNKKDYGWRAHVETLQMENGRSVNSRVYADLFLGRCILRPSCYECTFKQVMHPGDITIADYWGVDKVAPELDDDKGVSLVLINNEKGEQIFNNVSELLDRKETRIEDSMQPSLKGPFPEPENRSEFWIDFLNKPFAYIVKKYGTPRLSDRIRRVLRMMKRKLLK